MFAHRAVPTYKPYYSKKSGALSSIHFKGVLNGPDEPTISGFGM